ncbi:MAG: carbohydrate ABC transporter permease [Thermoflexales bacterium]|nr:carbohydrate ABC transporter permease [Thermoflexales bacterium]
MKSYKRTRWIVNGVAYVVLTFFALAMLFPFIYMITTSLKEPKDTFNYPPRLLPRQDTSMSVAGFDEPLPVYYVTVDGQQKEWALAQSNIRIGVYAEPTNLEKTYERPLADINPTGGASSQKTASVNGKDEPLWDVDVDGQLIPMVVVRQTTLGRFVNPADPTQAVLQNVRLSQPVQTLTAHPENYETVVNLGGMDRSLTNTILVTILVVVGQLTTSVLGGYAFARLKFPGRNRLFVLYLGTIMIPFVVLITPLYQLMVLIGWQDRIASLVIPWIFTAYGTFLMRQFFITVPKEIEEAALMDGASRLQILWRIFIPAGVPALATQATFTFLYAWNSFFWPLVIINTANTANHVLTLSLNVLRGRAADSPNIILAGAAISILPPMIVYVLAQRFFVESATSSGVKG